MPHFLVIAVLVLAAWTLLSVPLGLLIGRRLRQVNSAPLPSGCAYDGGRAPLPPPAAGPGAPVPGCTARPCRAVWSPAGRVRPCRQPRGAGGGKGHGVSL
ncbi:hypothetical protein [Streptomyces sp. NBC_01190]|uniref:hypothetical protein n=1 Tax=Streptomyces sp. NBC_01190 TaxID=2903767 RepID=UPI003863734E|nr:hypothetical protein OG519_00710 [Streptomyces sp. NBC_01190]